jgi:hypothetical protein
MCKDDQAEGEAMSVLIDQWRSATEPLDHFARRAVTALAERPGLLVRLLRIHIARPGPCGVRLEGLRFSKTDPRLPIQMCTLDAGHAGLHKDEESGAIWN